MRLKILNTADIPKEKFIIVIEEKHYKVYFIKIENKSYLIFRHYRISELDNIHQLLEDKLLYGIMEEVAESNLDEYLLEIRQALINSYQ